MKGYKLTSVYVVAIDGKPQQQVFTSFSAATMSAGVTAKRKPKEIDLFIHDGKVVRIVRAEIIRQNKGRKEDFRIKKNV